MAQTAGNFTASKDPFAKRGKAGEVVAFISLALPCFLFELSRHSLALRGQRMERGEAARKLAIQM